MVAAVNENFRLLKFLNQRACFYCTLNIGWSIDNCQNKVSADFFATAYNLFFSEL